jgi:hypothetical protein
LPFKTSKTGVNTKVTMFQTKVTEKGELFPVIAIHHSPNAILEMLYMKIDD